MANLGQKEGIYHIRFRFESKEYKRSLKTRDKADADAAKRSVEQTIYRLMVGLLQVPPDVDAGDFIFSGGTLTQPCGRNRNSQCPTTRRAIKEYLKAQQHVLAPSYHYSQRVHLRHLTRYLGAVVDAPCDRVTFRDLNGFLQERLSKRNPNTVARERITLIQFYKWLVHQKYVVASPATALLPIKGGVDRLIQSGLGGNIPATAVAE